MVEQFDFPKNTYESQGEFLLTSSALIVVMDRNNPLRELANSAIFGSDRVSLARAS